MPQLWTITKNGRTVDGVLYTDPDQARRALQDFAEGLAAAKGWGVHETETGAYWVNTGKTGFLLNVEVTK